MASDPLFGWDLTFKTVEKDVTRKADVIIAFIHFNLMKRGFRSIGIGDEVNFDSETECKILFNPKITESKIPNTPIEVSCSAAHSSRHIKNINKKYRSSPPWWDAECTVMIKTRKAAEKAFKLNMSLTNFLEYKRVLAVSKRLLRKKKKFYLRALAGDEEKSELLPTGWNDKENYTLRYVLDDKLYILHGLNTDGNLIINLMRSEDLVVSNIVVKIDDTVKEMQGQIDKMMPNHKELMFNVKRDLIDTITTRHTSTAETQTSGSAPRRISPQITPRPGPAVQPDHPNVWNPPPEQPFGGIGRSDLDPFGPGGGGMIFNPFGPRRSNENPGLGIPGGLARGAVPPGARFDPFGPPGAFLPSARGRSRPPPDSDHLPPPGFENDMFM